MSDGIFYYMGIRLNGYCGGDFGYDYGEKAIEAVGRDWIVARNEKGVPLLAHFPLGFDQLRESVERWQREAKGWE